MSDLGRIKLRGQTRLSTDRRRGQSFCPRQLARGDHFPGKCSFPHQLEVHSVPTQFGEIACHIAESCLELRADRQHQIVRRETGIPDLPAPIGILELTRKSKDLLAKDLAQLRRTGEVPKSSEEITPRSSSRKSSIAVRKYSSSDGASPPKRLISRSMGCHSAASFANEQPVHVLKLIANGGKREPGTVDSAGALRREQLGQLDCGGLGSARAIAQLDQLAADAGEGRCRPRSRISRSSKIAEASRFSTAIIWLKSLARIGVVWAPSQSAIG